jgi:hypothetical protein
VTTDQFRRKGVSNVELLKFTVRLLVKCVVMARKEAKFDEDFEEDYKLGMPVYDTI